jgi:hypothetical protein
MQFARLDFFILRKTKGRKLYLSFVVIQKWVLCIFNYTNVSAKTKLISNNFDKVKELCQSQKVQ